VVKGERPDIIASSIFRCRTWSSFKHLELTKNLRVENTIDPIERETRKDFANWALNFGNGNNEDQVDSDT
jgi:hypothetical protein